MQSSESFMRLLSLLFVVEARGTKMFGAAQLAVVKNGNGRNPCAQIYMDCSVLSTGTC